MSGFFYLIFILFSVTVKFTLLKCTITKSVWSNVHSVQCMFAKNVMFLIFSHHIVAINHSFLFISSGIPWYEWTTVSFLIHLLLDIWAVSSLELLCIKITFWPHLAACGDLVPRPGIKPTPPALEAWSLNHWTTREVPFISFCPPPPKKNVSLDFPGGAMDKNSLASAGDTGSISGVGRFRMPNSNCGLTTEPVL